MKSMILARWKVPIFFIILCLGLILLNFDLIWTLFFNAVMPGWDGAAHMAMAKIYAENIFPSSFGWAKEWYLGMPFPQFYPPLFFFCVALLSKILYFISFELVFKLFVFFSLLATPCLITVLSYKLSKNKLTAVLSGLFAVILLSYRGVDLNIGVGIGGTINTGLLANSLAFNFFVLWLINFLNHERSAKNYFFGAIFLSAVFLTNVHLIFPAFIFFVANYFTEIISYLKQQDFKKITSVSLFYYLPYGLLALGLTAYWLMPMLGHYDYFTTTTLNIGKEVLFYYGIIFCYVPFFFAMIFLANRPKGIKRITLLISVLLFAIAINTFFKLSLPLPLHVIRWLSPVIYLSAIPIADVFSFLYEQTERKKYRVWWTILLCVFIILSSYASLFAFRNMNGIYTHAKQDGIFEVVDFLKTETAENPNNLTLVEANTSGQEPRSFVLDSLLGQNGVATVFSNLRESSMSGLYMVPLRNLFSWSPEAWGIQSFLAFDENFLSGKTTKEKIDLASYFGVSTIVSSSPETTELLNQEATSTKVKGSWTATSTTKIFENDTFTIFNIKPKPVAEAVKTPIIAVFSEIQLKERDQNRLSFSRLSEEWMQRFDPNVIFVRPNNNLIEDNPVFSFSKIVLLDNYQKKSYDSAKETLTKYVQGGGKVYMVIHGNEDIWLFNYVYGNLPKTLKKSFVEIDFGTDMVGKTYSLLEKDVNDLILNGKKGNLATSTISSIDFERNTINLKVTALGSPILIKKSYFPNWQSDSGEVYLASPSLMLYVPKATSTSIMFKADKNNTLSYSISLASLILLIFVAALINKVKESLF